jgi:hypothetical protein
MTREQQAELIRAYARDLQAHLLKKLPEAPEEWDGRHLRNWFWMAAQDSYKFDLGRKENNALKNEIIVRNL